MLSCTGECLGDCDVCYCYRRRHRVPLCDSKRRAHTRTPKPRVGTHPAVHDAGRPLPVHPFPDHRGIFLSGCETPLGNHADHNTRGRPGAEHEPNDPGARRVEEAVQH